jgi:hypothetical protein
MADVLRRETADLPRVSVVDAGFEDWEPTASAFDLGGVVTMPTVSRLLRARRV